MRGDLAFAAQRRELRGEFRRLKLSLCERRLLAAAVCGDTRLTSIGVEGLADLVRIMREMDDRKKLVIYALALHEVRRRGWAVWR